MTKKSKDIVFTTALRTAIGKYKGMWGDFQAHDLGMSVIKKILSKSKVDPNFIYSSDNNKKWMKISALQNWIEKNREKIGNI